MHSAAETMKRINQAWLKGRIADLGKHLHEDIIMVMPGFSGGIQGKEKLLDGFRDFVENSTVHNFREKDQQVDVVGDTAVVTFRYEMEYTREDHRYSATGRDMWIFCKQNEDWIAVWRTMMDVQESPV